MELDYQVTAESFTQNLENAVQNTTDSFEQSNLAAQKVGQENEGDISTEILIVVFLLMLASTAGQFLKKSGHKYIQEAGLTVIIGMLAGLIFRQMNVTFYLQSLTAHFSGIFVILLLPPIIFESGYNMNKKYFFKNGGAVLMYSFLGTFIAIFSSSFMFWAFGQMHMSKEFTWQEAFAFGSLISATDPVSVLACFKEMDADVDLYAIIFGESIFNDAVAIVMYDIVMKAGGQNRTFGEEMLNGIGAFILIFVGSLFIGGIFALLIAFVLKRQSSYFKDSQSSVKGLSQRQRILAAKQTVMTEISMMILCPLVSYFIAGGLNLSGIVSILTNGVFLSYYAKPNISPAAKKIIKMLYEVVAHSAETIVFLFLGIGLFTIQHPFQTMGFGMFITTVINLNVARFLNILIVSYLVNLQRSPSSKLSSKTQFVMWFSGLRGAMAYALALQASTELPIGPVILITTLVYSLITILGLGSLLHPILSKMDVKNKNKLGEVTEPTENCFNRFKKQMSSFDTYYFAPLFIKDRRNIEDRALGRSESYIGNHIVQGSLSQELEESQKYLGQGYTKLTIPQPEILEDVEVKE